MRDLLTNEKASYVVHIDNNTTVSDLRYPAGNPVGSRRIFSFV